jgi:hypothetical protein
LHLKEIGNTRSSVYHVMIDAGMNESSATSHESQKSTRKENLF